MFVGDPSLNIGLKSTMHLFLGQMPLMLRYWRNQMITLNFPELLRPPGGYIFLFFDSICFTIKQQFTTRKMFKTTRH